MPFEVRYSGISNFGFLKIEDFQLFQAFEMFQPFVRDLGFVQRKLFELVQPTEEY